MLETLDDRVPHKRAPVYVNTFHLALQRLREADAGASKLLGPGTPTGHADALDNTGITGSK